MIGAHPPVRTARSVASGSSRWVGVGLGCASWLRRREPTRPLSSVTLAAAMFVNPDAWGSWA
jgi:hypothetical protein